MIVRRIWPPRRGWRSTFEGLEDMRRLFEAVEGAARESSGVFPPVNITQDVDNFYVRAELPGVKAADLELSAVRSSFSISGKREITPENASYHRREREGGAFSRSITLPMEFDGNKVEAQYVNGILTITLPKAAAAKPRQISVKTS